MVVVAAAVTVAVATAVPVSHVSAGQAAPHYGGGLQAVVGQVA